MSKVEAKKQFLEAVEPVKEQTMKDAVIFRGFHPDPQGEAIIELEGKMCMLLRKISTVIQECVC